jgi:3',5'-cyclic AMP phosphodiesterase CpdA
VSPSVVVVSDSHLSAQVADTGRNWAAALCHVESVRPDLVLHAGDLSMHGAHDPADLVYGRARMDEVPVPWRVVPGNHDVGDAVSAQVDPDDTVTADRLARWCDLLGPDRWAVDLGAWRVIGVNAQLFGTGLEAEQWEALEHELRRVTLERRRLLLVTHKPIAAPAAELAAAPPYRFVPTPDRDRLWETVRAAGAEAVLSGHVHQSRVLRLNGVTQLWAPTTWAVLPDSLQRTIGSKRCGLLELHLPEEGPCARHVVEPAGMAQLVIPDGVAYPPAR